MKCLVFHSSKSIVLQFLKTLHILLNSLDFEYKTFLTHPFEKITPNIQKEITEELDKGIDFILCLGGDGTVLVNARLAYYGHTTPVLAINFGHLGFLAENTIDELEEILINIKEGNYITENRILLFVEYKDKNGDIKSTMALNEVFVGGNHLHQIGEFITYVDQFEIARYKGDGVILATPTGSTAYNLSAGGPILLPHLENFVMTAVAPHRLTNRALVLPSSVFIEIKSASSIPQNLFVDGNFITSIKKDQTVSIKKAPIPLVLIYSKNRNYFDTLRKKLNWAL